MASSPFGLDSGSEQQSTSPHFANVQRREWAVKIFFDVDGVLIDGWHAKPELRRPWDATIEEDLGIDRDAFREKFFGSGSTNRAVIHACIRGERDLKEALAETLPAVGYAGPVHAFMRYWFEKDSNINRDVMSAVERLARHAHVELYLATGQEHHRAAYLWDELGFRRHFRDIFYSARIGHLKSAPEFYFAINEALAIGAGEQPLFFDDREDVVALARGAGWDACLFDTVNDLINHPRVVHLL
jgi:putative hydrolase of the HAD superfamily